MTTNDAIIICLPRATDAADNGCAWWRVSGGHVTESGDRSDWLDQRQGGGRPSRATHLLAIAPAAETVFHQLAIAAMPPRQAIAVASRMIAEDAPDGGAGQLHVAAVDGPGGDGQALFVSVPTATMVRWRGWAAERGLELSSIVPAALLLPPVGSTDGAVQAQVGGEDIIRTATTAFPADAALITMLVPHPQSIAHVPGEAIEQAMVAACAAPPAELLCGAFAPRVSMAFDRCALPLIGKLVTAFIILSLTIPLVQILFYYRDASRMDGEAAAAAAQIVAPAPPLDQAIARIDQKLAELGGGPALVTTPIAALVMAMEPAPTVRVDSIDWRGDGVMSATLGGPRAEDINPVLIAIQRAGYRITAQPRAGTDGRALADITIRSGP